MNCGQRAVRFLCQGSNMVGIIDLPERPLSRGVLMAAGQAHSRLGESRQYAMLARALARRGIAVMRFDRRGVGDSEGCNYNDNDVLAALRELRRQVPALRDIVLLGPASGGALREALACAAVDEQISGLILVETWHAHQLRGRRAAHAAPPLLRVLAEAGAIADAPRVPARARLPGLFAVASTATARTAVANTATTPMASTALASADRPMLAAAAPASRHALSGLPGLPVEDALNWRRARLPRRRPSAEQRLSALTAQLCAFPGPVLVVAAPPATGGGPDGNDGNHGNDGDASVRGQPRNTGDDTTAGTAHAADADLQAGLARLSRLVAGHCPGRPIDVVCAAAAGDGDGLRDGDGPGRGSLTDICASWLVSW